MTGDESEDRHSAIFEPDLGPWLLHPQFHQHGTHTGRLSSSSPSLHNLPKGKSPIKLMFPSRFENGLILNADYSQIEVRIFANECGDEGMLQAFKEGLDFHQYTASRLFRVPLDEVSGEQRGRAKACTFAILYGGGPDAIAKGTANKGDDSLSYEEIRHEAEIVLHSFFEQFPKAREYMDGQHKQVVLEKRVFSPLGRIFPFHQELAGADHQGVSSVQRKSVNYPIQSTASDLNLMALGRLWGIYGRLWQSVPFASVHDSIVYDVYPGELLKVMHGIRKEMINATYQACPWLRVLIEQDFEVGVNWGKGVKANLCEIPNQIDLQGDGQDINEIMTKLKQSHKVKITDLKTEEKMSVRVMLGVK